MSITAHKVDLQLGNVQILADVSVKVPNGHLTALIGPNGAGKSSLLKVLSGDVTPSNGEVLFQNTPLPQIPVAKQARVRSVMAQAASITFDFLVDDILRMGWVQGDYLAPGEINNALSNIINACELHDLLGRTFNTLSGGEQRRVQFARALLQIWQPAGSHEPRYLLLDEPTANLDLAHELMLLRLAKQQAEQGVGVLVVLHDLNLTARFADNVYLMADGRVVAKGSPMQVFQPERLSEVYQTPVHVERHEKLERLIVFT